MAIAKSLFFLLQKGKKRLTHEKDINQHNPHAMHNGKMTTIKKN
jgi:hypothetical protein